MMQMILIQQIPPRRPSAETPPQRSPIGKWRAATAPVTKIVTTFEHLRPNANERKALG